MSSVFVFLSIPLTGFGNLDSVRSVLERKGELYFICLLVASFAVAIGCILEVPDTWSDLKDWIGRRKQSVVPSSWRVPMAALGLLLVVLGVVGEGVFEALVSINETALRAHDELVLGDTIKKAGTAKESADAAGNSATKAGYAALRAEEKANAVENKASRIMTDLIAIQTSLALANTQLRAVEAKRAALEVSLRNLAVCNAPRVIPLATIGTKTTADPMLVMAGQKVMIEVVADGEAKRAASNLATVLSVAKWNVLPVRVVDGLKDGVWVEPANTPAANPTLDPVEKLLGFLHSFNWQARKGLPHDLSATAENSYILPADAVDIQIGLYPATAYVRTPGEKEFAGEWRQKFEASLAESKRKREEYLETLPPEFRKTVKKGDADWDASMRTSDVMYPCQILDPFP